MTVLREEEFAPGKNINGSTFDTSDSAKLLVLRLHSRWVVAAGGFLTHSVPLYATSVEVSPLCSYAGENLEAICRGRTFDASSPQDQDYSLIDLLNTLEASTTRMEQNNVEFQQSTHVAPYSEKPTTVELIEMLAANFLQFQQSYHETMQSLQRNLQKLENLAESMETSM
ncbi:hypothetical protein F8388_020376, partial [Cannabis sativa]